MKKYTFLFLLVASFSSAYCQLQAIKNQADYPFLLHLPADSILKSKPPVLIFLHGRSLSGTNLDLVKRYGVIHEIEKGRKVPAIVVAPQVLAGKSWEPEKILSVLKFVQRTFDTDTNRVYVAGMSLGGYGTLRFAGAYPEIVTAAVALCGGGNTSDGCDLATVPLWIQHGNQDEAVPISESEKIVKAIKNCNGGENLKYTVHKGANHGALERVFRTDEMYNWLFQYTKEDKN
ncbi:MAG: prolyl oligopeptidase family serine peptidase [Crocinitomicaceae bacterium]|jgi:predicted peptidase